MTTKIGTSSNIKWASVPISVQGNTVRLLLCAGQHCRTKLLQLTAHRHHNVLIHSINGKGQSRLILTQAWKQTSGDPSGQTCDLLHNFTTALLYMVSSVKMARILAMLLTILLHSKD